MSVTSSDSRYISYFSIIFYDICIHEFSLHSAASVISSVLSDPNSDTENKGQSNLAKGDITLLSYSPGGSTRGEVARGRCICDLNFGRRGGRWGSAMVPFERAMVVSYRLSIVIIALSQTILPQFVIKCLRRSYQQEPVTLG